MHGTLPPIARPIDILIEGDCLHLLADIPDQTIDLVVCDLPYGTTRSGCDVPVDLAALWEHLRRVLTPTGTVLMFGSQPFTTALVNAAPDLFKYALVWSKDRATGHVHAPNKPMKAHEDILVFSLGTTMHATRSSRRMTYNPVGVVSAGRKVHKNYDTIKYLGQSVSGGRVGEEYEARANYPRSILTFPKDGRLHPFQKPVALLAYLIETFSNPSDMILDPCMGSGSTGVAALQSSRSFVGFEDNPAFFDIAEARVAAERAPTKPQLDIAGN